MASFNLSQHTHLCVESPAKIFAKLKSKVQTEAMSAKNRFFTDNDPLYNVRMKNGAEFHSPRKKTTNVWIDDELKENKRFGSHHNDAQAMTLSPISSPLKPCEYSYKPLAEASTITDTVLGFVRRDGNFLESTAVSQPPCVVNKDQIQKETQIKTPVKTQLVENNGKSVFDKKVASLNHMSLTSMFSPMSNRLRKRKLEQQEYNKVSRTTEESTENVTSSQERRKSTSTEDYTHNNTYTKNLGCYVVLEKFPIMSPAKMFAYMKDRECKKEKQVHNSSRRELFGNMHRSSDPPVSTTHSLDEMEETSLQNTPESVVPVNQNSPNDLSVADASEDAPIPASPARPILLEDPLVLNSPQISVPKKDKAVLKRNCWPTSKKFPVESVVYLKKWFLRRNQKGIFVDGIHGEKNIPWNSNIIVDRVSNSVLKTISGRVYILDGRMNMDLASDFPKGFLKKFVRGFPANWKTLFENFLSESNNSKAKRKDKEENITSLTNPEASSIDASVKRRRLKSLETPDSCPTSSTSTKVSRSGRVIKPPLEYWKGGRVVLDAQMNVTIHEGYDTFISEVSTVVSPRTSKKPVHVFLPSSEGLTKSQSVTDEETPELVRRVRALRNQSRAEVKHDKKSPNLLEPTRDVRVMRSSQRCSKPVTERGMSVEDVPQKQSERPTQRSNQTYIPNKPSKRTSRRKQADTKSPGSPVIDQKSSCLSSEDESPIKRKKKGKGAHNKKGVKPRLVNTLSSSQSSESFEESRKELRKRSRREIDESETRQKENKCTKTSQPIQTLPALTRPRRKQHANKNNTLITQEQAEDGWTEVELMKLQGAVSFYPKHITDYWAKVARMVGTRSAEECHKQHTLQGPSQSPVKRAKKHSKEKVDAPNPAVAERPVISARAGTLKRKQQVRHFLEALPREDVDDAFSSAYMQKKRFEIPSMCPSDEQDFDMSDLEPQTPMSSCFPEAKTPQCLHITPGMIGSPTANNGDKYVYQLQKRMKKNQFNVCKTSRSSKRFTPTPSVKRTLRRCGNTENDTFVVWEMFPGNDGRLSESGEEEDFYFSDN